MTLFVAISIACFVLSVGASLVCVVVQEQASAARRRKKLAAKGEAEMRRRFDEEMKKLDEREYARTARERERRGQIVRVPSGFSGDARVYADEYMAKRWRSGLTQEQIEDLRKYGAPQGGVGPGAL